MSEVDWAAKLWHGVIDAEAVGAPEHALVSPGAYRDILWETEGRQAWEGRDWRRIKRERRKFVRGPSAPQ